MKIRPFRAALGLRACALVALAGPLAAQTTAPFDVLDNIEGDNVDLVFAPVKPMVLEPGDAALWAINTHGSTVNRYTSTSGPPNKVFPVPWGPVSIEYWDRPSPLRDELLVVSRGTYTLTRLSPATGDVLHVLELPPEPAGTVLVGDHLFVACSAWDVVVEIDLLTNTLWQQYEVDTSKHLCFLSREGSSSNVLVAPMLSGNNSMTKNSPLLIPDKSSPPIDMTNATQPLPDHDLFRIVPSTTAGLGTIAPVAVGLGTNLFMHAVHPNGTFWCLNTRAHNTGADGHGAPALKARSDLFTTSGVTLTTLPGVGGNPVSSHTFTELVDHAVPNAANTIAKPYALAFLSGATNSAALVVGASTDNVRILNASGVPLAGTNHFAVSDGAIPRGILYNATLAQIVVYCWGTNKVEVYTWADVAAGGAPNNITGSLSLGYDPATADVKKGREIFFDARRSKFGNATCESCHLDGLFDFVVWENSPLPFDDKGPMFTQSLRGIADKRPYHWRGEQNDLVDFNGVFPDLFDAPALSTGPGSDFEKLQKYLFQLENPANPFEHEDRVITDDTTATRFDPPQAPLPGLSAVNGQLEFQNGPSVNDKTCAHCHGLPTGTTSDFFEDGFLDQHHRSSFDSTAFNGMWRKDPKTRVTVQIDNTSATEERAPLGSGTSHAGLLPGVWEFVVDQFSMPQDDEEDIVFFLHQLDSGLAPSVHRGRLLNGTAANTTWIQNYLINGQAEHVPPHCDVAVFGTSLFGTTSRRLRWYYDRANDNFVCEDPVVGTKLFSFFTGQVALGGRNVFIGLPVGMGRRWAVDYDGDDLLNVHEQTLTTDTYAPDTDGDGFYDGVEVFNVPPSDPKVTGSVPSDSTAPNIVSVTEIWHNANTAKYIVETNELTRLTVDYTDNVNPAKQTTSEGWKRLHTVLLRDLEPSYVTTLPGVTPYNRTYDVTFKAFDQAGNQSTPDLKQVTTSSFITALEEFPPGTPLLEREVRVEQMTTYAPTALGGGVYRLKFDVELADVKHPTNTLANHVAVARVIVTRGSTVQRWNTFIDVHVNKQAPKGIAFTNVLNPQFNAIYIQPSDSYAIGSITAGNVSQIEIDLENGLPGDVVQISIETAGEVDASTFDPHIPVFRRDTMFEFPSTLAADRVSAGVTLP